jgi:hypothetical protein
MKKRPRFTLFAWVEWPCKDITRHEILSEAVCPFTFKREFELATPDGPIWKRWSDTKIITNSAYGQRGAQATPMWTC